MDKKEQHGITEDIHRLKLLLFKKLNIKRCPLPWHCQNPKMDKNGVCCVTDTLEEHWNFGTTYYVWSKKHIRNPR